MELDTLTLAPGKPANQNLTPIEQAAQQLVDHITNIITTEHTNNTRNQHEAETRATNAERQYERLCTDYETLLTDHNTLKQQLADTPPTSPETTTE